MSIKEFIKAVQNRPLMYVEEIKIEYIYYLVVGFLGSNLINKAGYSIDDKFHAHFYHWVLDWIKKNVDKNYDKVNFFWCNFFKDITDNEEEAVQMFFKLCDEFFEEVDGLER